ncbi:hypothetical protein PENSPDRAFT_662524 [Peniophora sp. CONT]|nr:hypothetical protein PENSPDRAFT_662524 [Peniophora sp. CONT]
MPSGSMSPPLTCDSIREMNARFLAANPSVSARQLYGHRIAAICAALAALFKRDALPHPTRKYALRIVHYIDLLQYEMGIYEETRPWTALDCDGSYRLLRKRMRDAIRADDNVEDKAHVFERVIFSLPEHYIVEEDAWSPNIGLGDLQWWTSLEAALDRQGRVETDKSKVGRRTHGSHRSDLAPTSSSPSAIGNSKTSNSKSHTGTPTSNEIQEPKGVDCVVKIPGHGHADGNDDLSGQAGNRTACGADLTLVTERSVNEEEAIESAQVAPANSQQALTPYYHASSFGVDLHQRARERSLDVMSPTPQGDEQRIVPLRGIRATSEARRRRQAGPYGDVSVARSTGQEVLSPEADWSLRPSWGAGRVVLNRKLADATQPSALPIGETADTSMSLDMAKKGYRNRHSTNAQASSPYNSRLVGSVADEAEAAQASDVRGVQIFHETIEAPGSRNVPVRLRDVRHAVPRDPAPNHLLPQMLPSELSVLERRRDTHTHSLQTERDICVVTPTAQAQEDACFLALQGTLATAGQNLETVCGDLAEANNAVDEAASLTTKRLSNEAKFYQDIQAMLSQFDNPSSTFQVNNYPVLREDGALNITHARGTEIHPVSVTTSPRSSTRRAPGHLTLFSRSPTTLVTSHTLPHCATGARTHARHAAGVKDAAGI